MVGDENGDTTISQQRVCGSTSMSNSAAQLPRVSVIVPCRNEAGQIGAALTSIAAADYASDRLEIIIADGMSDDGTRDTLAAAAAADPRIRVIDNPARTTPAALNAGLAAAAGEVIVRMDAHAVYPPDYVSRLVHELVTSEADNVGGVCRTLPANDGLQATAIAIALSHRLGVGGARFRVGAEAPAWVDTVPFGCWRREVFERIGQFDEDLVRNQDDAFNARLRQAGGRIRLLPDVVIDYHARPTIAKLWRMYFEYGLFKPLACRKAGAIFSLRQLAPAALVAATLLATVGSCLSPIVGGTILLGGAALYGSALFLAAAERAVAHRRVLLIPPLVCAFAALHFSYGVGYLKGILYFCILTRRPPELVPNR
jgi:glycosyltransferase involved in cell wall biosynthesis